MRSSDKVTYNAYKAYRAFKAIGLMKMNRICKHEIQGIA